ncbi:MAG: c-type cytochrome biogenesis protein CcmI [Alphaproteobacteria bacterium]|jgi:cytochrome c-type biogenesis protein CcmH|nr:c-type cytochrome biogenesis protein CcmI [Alphaproteobacteria bacterium]
MTAWLVFAGLALVAAAALALPMLRRRGAATTRAEFDLEVFRAQLADLEADHARGVLGEAELAAARTEIERRMLTAASDAGVEQTAERSALLPALAVAIVVPLASLGLYASLGLPEAPDVPLADREAPGGMPADMDEAVAGLAERLKENPDDFEGWFMLGRSYAVMDRYDDAAAALAQAVALQPENIDALISYGEALVFAADGLVTPVAAQQFETILALDPENVAGRFYHGTAQLQAGDGEGAFETWGALAVASPPDAPWLPTVMERLEVLADELDLSVPEVEIAEAEVPAEAPNPEEMVARLEARLQDEPDDGEGWMRLGRAKQVLGDLAASRAAYENAVRVLPDNVEALTALAQVIGEEANAETLPDEALTLYARVLEIDPHMAEALWFLGLDASQRDAKDEAREYWQRLLALMAPGSEGHQMLQEQIDAL